MSRRRASVPRTPAEDGSGNDVAVDTADVVLRRSDPLDVATASRS
jgi:cation transport ATPase